VEPLLQTAEDKFDIVYQMLRQFMNKFFLSFAHAIVFGIA